MANLQTSGAISIGNIKTLFGGPASPAMSNYYRGGSYIPSHRLDWVLVRVPASGYAYSRTAPVTYWSEVASTSTARIYWNGVLIKEFPMGVTSYTVAGITYYRGVVNSNIGVWPDVTYLYSMYRTDYQASQVPINTGIPTSGQISLSQFYGAEKP